MRSTRPELARSALDAAPDAMIIIDASGQILFANRQVSVLFGHEHDAIVGQQVEALMPERFRRIHGRHRDEYAHSMRLRPMGANLDLYALRRDGSEFPVEVSLSPVQDGDQVLIAAAIRDISERNRVKGELIDAREAADRANLAKSRFLATASHDLRQPLQTLALLNGTLLRLVHDAEAVAALTQQELAIGAMARLLNALLDISKLESGAIKPELSDFKVAAIFEELRNEFATIAARKGLDLRIQSSAHHVYSDPSLVEQILRNLLSNAIKYTRAGRVVLHCTQDGDSKVRIEVKDTGIGIPADELPYIYDEFYQIGVPANSTRDGYGLGLSIVQRLVKLLNLGFDVRSEIGKGSAFTLVLPGSMTQPLPTPVGSRHSTPKAPQQTGRTHVLLVEDDSGVRDATRMLLRVEGYKVSAVSSLAEAVQVACQDADINLLVTDYHLGGSETGTQVVASVREQLARPAKAVLITGDTSSAIRDLAVDERIRVASKPIKADELLAMMRELLAS